MSISQRKTNRIGEKNVNNYGSLMTIVEYNNANDVVVEFENGYRIKATYQQFKKGEIKNPYDKTIYNIGYVGEGSYKVSVNNKLTIEYKYWHSMLQRCYDKKSLERLPTYENKYVCESWLNFQNFCKWFNEHYYEVDDKVMELDKDILNKGNEVYSPSTCIFVPSRINTLFIKANAIRGKHPLGVSYHKKVKKFQASCRIYDKETKKKKLFYLGLFETPELAFRTYKEFKENYIKQVAEEYKDKIPQKLYEAMYRYEVEIDD